MAENIEPEIKLCGLWVDSQGGVHLAHANGESARSVTTHDGFRPFAWSQAPITHAEELDGESSLNYLTHFDNPDAFDASRKAAANAAEIEAPRPLEHQYLLQTGQRLFTDLPFEALRRCQLDIETDCSVEGGFSNPKRPEDRILAIGLRMAGQNHYLQLSEKTDKAERLLLKELNAFLAEHDPDIIEGHNIFKFDLEYLRRRCQRYRVPCAWGRFGQNAVFRNSRIRIAERWIDFPRCDLPGRTVFDTYLMVQIYDITKRELPSYTLKAVARHLGITDLKKDQRTYLSAVEIQDTFDTDRDRFLAYLGDDLRETDGIAALLLPTYVAQVKSFPITLQEACLRGTANKVEMVILDKYYHAKHSLPMPSQVERFAGAFTRSFETGVYHNVLHYDVASLYPSILLHLNKNPKPDKLGVFIPLLKELREQRLRYKQMAREATDSRLAQEYQARQSSFKILINSFYGYLGFGNARFADSDLAGEVTQQGRDLLQKLIEKMQSLDCTVLEADTDGIYVASEKFFSEPEALLTHVESLLPEGIDLEFDGKYKSMFCYKAKNYALYDGEKISIAGSALRSRGIEPFLKELTTHLIHYLLGAEDKAPYKRVEEIRQAIESGDYPVEKLAKTEYLSQSPTAYQKAIETKGKSRRASLEVALTMEPQPGMGEAVSYYITMGEKKRIPDWKVARPLNQYDPQTQTYDRSYYLRKLDDWLKRYADFLEIPQESVQTELF